MTIKGKISVIVAVYNGEKTIRRTIQSVLNQRYENFELIIINDGSEDSTADHVRAFKDERIVFKELKSNQGVSSARNKGLEIMSGEFFCFLDADDIFPIDSLSSRVELFNNDNSLLFVDGIVEKRNLGSNRLVETYVPRFKGDPLKELLLLNDSCFIGQSWMIRNSLRTMPKFNMNLTHGEDLLFFAECARHGGNYSYVETVVLIYNQHENSAMGNIRGLEKFYRFYLKFLPEFIDTNIISREDLQMVRRKIRRILFRSYLKILDFRSGIKSLFIK